MRYSVRSYVGTNYNLITRIVLGIPLLRRLYGQKVTIKIHRYNLDDTELTSIWNDVWIFTGNSSVLKLPIIYSVKNTCCDRFGIEIIHANNSPYEYLVEKFRYHELCRATEYDQVITIFKHKRVKK